MSILLYYGDLDISDEINYKIDLNGFKAPEPTVKQQYADSALRHGQLPTEAWKYNNRILDFTIQVFGSTPAELDTNIKILEYTVCVAGAVVTYCPNGRTTNIYFNTFRPEEVDPSTYFERTYQRANMAIIKWSVQAYPFGYTDRRYLYPCKSIGLDDSFEKRDGNDFEHWLEEVSGGGTITANTSEYLKGGVSCRMITYHDSDTCKIEDEDYLTVNELHAHNAKLYAYNGWGTLTLDFDLLCYDDDGNLLGTLSLLAAYNPAATTWMDVLKVAGSPVVYPSDSGLSPRFPVGTTKVKRWTSHSTTVGVVSLDSLLFEDADMIQGNELEGAFVINIPADMSSGDVPADAQIKVGSAYCSGPWSPQNSGLGAWWLEGVAAVDASHVWAVGNLGAIKFYNGLTWASQASGTTKGLRAIAAYDATTAWAVGDEGTLSFWNGTNWTHSGWGTRNLYGVCAIAANNVVIVGEAGLILVNGVQKTSGTAYDLHDVDAADASHIWAVGDYGTIRFSNGTTWVAQTSGTTKNLRAVYAVDSTHVWAVGESGVILFYNGTHWTRQTSGTTQSLYGVYVYDATHVWAVGSNGAILFFNGTIWTAQGSDTPSVLMSVSGISATSVWAVGQNGTIIHGVVAVSVMSMTNFDIGERDIQYASNFAAVQDAAGTTQVLDVYRHGQYYRSLAAGSTHKFRYPVGSHRGRYILSVGTSWASTTTYDQLSIKLYLETADGIKISPLPDISLTPLDLGNPTGLFKETAFATAGTRLVDIDVPSHYVSPKANEDNIYQVIEVTNNAEAPAEWLDCCTLLPAERCVELSSMAANFLIFDSEAGEVLVSQDGSFDTAAVYDPTKTVDSPRFVIDPRGCSFVVLAGNIVSGNERFSPLLDIEISWEPQWLMIPWKSGDE